MSEAAVLFARAIGYVNGDGGFMLDTATSLPRAERPDQVGIPSPSS
jgi:hypothetical protein